MKIQQGSPEHYCGRLINAGSLDRCFTRSLQTKRVRLSGKTTSGIATALFEGTAGASGVAGTTTEAHGRRREFSGSGHSAVYTTYYREIMSSVIVASSHFLGLPGQRFWDRWVSSFRVCAGPSLQGSLNIFNRRLGLGEHHCSKYVKPLSHSVSAD